MNSSYDDFIARKLVTVPPTGLTGAFDLPGSLFPFQSDVTRWACRRGRCAIFAGTGLGKALPVDEPVLTPRGFVPIGTLRIGDEVTGSNGKPCRVTGVFPQGQRPAFNVTFSDGGKARCDGEHLWHVITKKERHTGKIGRVLTLNQIVAEGLRFNGGRRHFIPIVAPVEFYQHADFTLPIDPYTLGVLLGDGGLSHGTPSLTTDDEIIDGLILPATVTAKRTETAGPGVGNYELVGPGRGHSNALTDVLRTLELWGKRSEAKHIPSLYLHASVDDRWKMLRGLLDTDGYIGKDGHIEYSTSSPDLARDVTYLVRSLGGLVRAAIKMAPKYTHNGEKRTGLPSHRLCIQLGGDICPFALARKAARWSPRTKYQPVRAIEEVSEAGATEMVCIAVDAPDHLFVTRDFVVTHNTRMSLSWAREVQRHTGGNILVLAPLAVARQTRGEGAEIGIDVTLCREGSDVRPGINVTNYDRLDRFAGLPWAGVVCGESSIMKHHTAKTFAALCDAFADVAFKLCETATPAPNDHTELGQHAEFLGICTRQEMLSEFFCHDGGETQKWRLKGHARKAFWRWIASFAALVRKPSDLGYDDGEYALPPLHMHEHIVEANAATYRSAGYLIPMEARGLTEQRVARKGSIGDRVSACAAQVNAESGEHGAPAEPWVIWCDLNDESKALTKAIPGAVEVTGSMTAEEKEQVLTDFAEGRVRVLVSKPSICGWGLNWQHAARMAFVGVTHSWEAFYQAVRREWRFGQAREVHVHVFVSEAEGGVLANLKRKEADAARLGEELARETRDAVRAEIAGSVRTVNEYAPRVRLTVPKWLKSERADEENAA